ncbi:MAG TPA: alkaline phosphatase family protein [Steroidobacteraceae bacterium]|jgi:phospholipase C|nr:alkaline phosphatase family protein [Steroidobacteraceae bacterium]
MADIKHVFVLMLENRSFDHLFAFAGLGGMAPPDPNWGMTDAAPDRAPLDPPHEFEDVAAQIGANPSMSGFAQQSYWAVSRQGFAAGALPVLRTLADEYCLFDNWYSSMPGPTWPNRFFVHAGTSGGLDNSPSAATTIESETVDSLSFSFPNGTLYTHLAAANRSWRVYHDDVFPQVLAIKEMVDPFRLNTARFSWVRAGESQFFADDLNNGYDVDYTFIEPNYGLAAGGFADGNCQHPVGSMAAGEAFIQYIYESIRNSAVWPQSMLVITYDEHGAFFDHQNPPAAIAPDDGTQNHERAEHPQNFAFDRLGVRVPTVIVSPWIARGGLGSRLFPGKVFDHTAIVKTVMKLFGVSGGLGARTQAANSFEGICSLPAMRTDGDAISRSLPELRSLPEPRAAAAPQSPGASAAPADEPSDHSTNAFSRIAMSLDLSMKQSTPLPPVAVTHPTFAMDATHGQLMPHAITAARSKRQTLDYIQAVAARVERLRPP